MSEPYSLFFKPHLFWGEISLGLGLIKLLDVHYDILDEDISANYCHRDMVYESIGSEFI